MAIFKKTKAGETTVYTNVTDGRQVKAEDLDPALKEELDLADFDTEIDDETVTKGEGDGVVDANGNPVDNGEKGSPEEEVEEPKKPVAQKPRQNRAKQEKPAEDANEDEAESTSKNAEVEQRINPYRKDVPQSEKGFGFPRVKGKTVDIFDGKTPHTQVRLVAGMLVPVSDENYKTKTDAEIYDRLAELELV